MNQLGRRCLLALSALAAGPGLAAQVRVMPEFGSGPRALGQAIALAGPGLRHVQNLVSAVNFDFRSLDTIGEEFMLMCAVTGTVLLLRGGRGEGTTDRPVPPEGRPLLERAESTILAGWICIPLILVYGIYVVLHATVTPGGGFQGGAIAASGLALGFVAGGYHAWRRMARSPVLAALEAAGALLFIGSGLAVMGAGGAFMENRLPLGQAGDILSGGIMVIENLGVGLAVFAAFLMLFLEFLEETRMPKPAEEPGPGGGGRVMNALPWALCVWLFAIGLYGAATSRNYLHLIGCLSVCQSSTYVLLLAIGYRRGGAAPVLHDHPPGTPVVDPVMQALALTDIVVGAAVTALLLAMAIQVFKRRRCVDPQRLRPMQPPK